MIGDVLDTGKKSSPRNPKVGGVLEPRYNKSEPAKRYASFGLRGLNLHSPEIGGFIGQVWHEVRALAD